MIATLRESKARLSELVQLASSGEDVLITVHGKPRARLVPVGGLDAEISEWMDELAELRSEMPSGPDAMESLAELREDRW